MQLEQDRARANVERRRREDNLKAGVQNTIKELSNRFNDLMDQGKYTEAEQVAMQIMEIDPDEMFGPAAMQRAQLFRRFALTNDVELRKREGWWKMLQEVEVSSIPVPDDPPIVYINPKAWEELSARRMKYRAVDLTERTEQTKKIERALTQPVVLDFKETPLTDVVDSFANTPASTSISIRRVCRRRWPNSTRRSRSRSKASR